MHELKKNCILIVHPGALGDVLLSLKALRCIKLTFPDQRIIWLGRYDVGKLLLVAGEVDECVSIDGQILADLFDCHLDRWSAVTRSILDSCTRIVCWLKDIDGDITKNFQLFGIESMIVCSPLDDSFSSQSVEDRYLETLVSWNLNQEIDRKRLQVEDWSNTKYSGEESIIPCEAFDQAIAIHPGSGSRHKCVDPTVLATVASRLLSVRNRKLYILSGPADGELVKSLCSLLPVNSFHVIEGHSLPFLVHFLSRVNLFIGHDSGLTHLAAICGIPSVVLFGPTDPCQWAPQGTKISVIQGSSCDCTNDWSRVRLCQDKPCLDIPVERIVQESEHWLELSVSEESSTLEDPKMTPCL